MQQMSSLAGATFKRCCTDRKPVPQFCLVNAQSRFHDRINASMEPPFSQRGEDGGSFIFCVPPKTKGSIGVPPVVVFVFVVVDQLG